MIRRLSPLAALALVACASMNLGSPTSSHARPPAGEGLPPALAAAYADHCATCHEAGAGDAPRRGDEADWARRRARGLPVLVERVRAGTLAMPPRGLCFPCSDADLEALATYVSAWPGTP